MKIETQLNIFIALFVFMLLNAPVN